MFDHQLFNQYTMENVPLNRDVFLMDEQWIEEYEAALVRFFNGEKYENVGYISNAAVRNADKDGLDLSWYPNFYDRFHEVRIRLPKAHFITCVDCWQCDEKPHIFVKAGWLKALYLRPFSTFAMVDAIGVKDAIRREQINATVLKELRTRIDKIAAVHRDACFVSFADSLLIKVNWSVGTFDTDVNYTYEPELILRIIPELIKVFEDVVGLKIYAIATQGANEYYDESPIYISSERNHICLNSIGLPFAQLMAIDSAVQDALSNNRHAPAELYIDANLYHSLKFKHDFDKKAQPSFRYRAPMANTSNVYYATDFSTVLRNMEAEPALESKE